MEWSDEKSEKLRDMWELGYSALGANQETLPKIRGETLGRRLATEQTRSLLDGLIRAGWLRLVTKKTAGRAVHRWQVNPQLFRGASLLPESPERPERGLAS